VVEPNTFTANVEQAKQTEPKPASVDEFWTQFTSELTLEAAKKVFTGWQEKGHRWRLGPNHMVLMAEGPSVNGLRTVVALYSDGRVLVPFGSYGGQNSGIPIEPLTTEAFRATTDALFGFHGSERQARTGPGWLTPATAEPLLQFCIQVAEAYAAAHLSVAP
jgi:hypothetical protein